MYVSVRQRTLSALAALLIVTLGMMALVWGLAIRLPVPTPPLALETIVTTRDLPDKPVPPPRPRPEEPEASTAKGEPSPPNLRNRATPVVAPPPRLPPLVEPPPVIAAPVPDTGSASSTGASDRPGPGQGAGGSGSGSGGGGSGSAGTGGQSIERPATLPRQIRGRLRFSDLPPDLRRSRQGAELTLRYHIGTDGRVSDCRILVSSGRPELDIHTCQYITERFRFRPALDARKRAVPFVMTEIHGWDDAGD